MKVLREMTATIKNGGWPNPLFSRWRDFYQLARMDRPIGTYLLLWPTLWALWLAADGTPSFHNFVVFTLGVLLTRSAGCVVNDWADRNYDVDVKRTRSRPMVTGTIKPNEALIFAGTMFLLAFLLVLTTNTFTVALSFAGLLLACIYPFAKRFTHLPQVVLGAAFSWSIPMAFAAETGTITSHAWLLFFANLLWIVAYDTQYAMVDRDDDLKIGIKSTAILFGELDNFMIVLFQALSLITLVLLSIQLEFAWPFYITLILALTGFARQYLLTRNRERDNCFKAFLSNHWIGAALFLGFVSVV